MDFKAAVFIGRFQPLHHTHLDIVSYGLRIAEKIIIIVGSANAAPNIKNPWSFEQRKEMIQLSINPQDRHRVVIEPIRDYFYSDNTWTTDIQTKVSQHVSSGDSVALLGNFKDSSSYYLKYFPQWEFVSVRSKRDFNATDIREKLFEECEIDTSSIPEGASGWIRKWMFEPMSKSIATKENELSLTAEFENLRAEYNFLKEYKKSWESAPYQPTFVTTDAVVVQSGHVLVVKRKFNPGKGLYALPGGFIRGNERIEGAALRELKEETGIKVDKLILQGSIKDSQVFDHPGRSLRGRTITHAYYIRLKDGELPEVRGSDDAIGAFWMPLMDLGANEARFFEDHFHIINFFINQS